MKEVPLILYSTGGCHLCEEAKALLRVQRQQSQDLCWEVIDIANDDVLFDRYAWLIPVLCKVNEENTEAGIVTDELRWPFSAENLREFLETSRDGL